MFSYRSMTPLFVHQAIVAVAVLAGLFWLQQPLALLALLLLPGAPVLPDEPDEDTDAVGNQGFMGFVDPDKDD